MDWRFPSGAHIEMTHLEQDSSVYAHDGAQYAMVGFDELQHFTEFQFWYMLSRLRSMCGLRPYLRGTCNPHPNSFLAKLLIPFWVDEEGDAIFERSGVIRWFIRDDVGELHWADSREELVQRFGPRSKPMSFTFIPARLSDNPILMAADPTYETKLEALPLIERRRLRDGNWKIRAGAGTLFKRDWFDYADKAPMKVLARVRAWDLAATEVSAENKDPAWTVGMLMSITDDGQVFVEDLEALRGKPGAVKQRVKRTAERDGSEVIVAIWRDPGQAGVDQVEENYRKLLKGFKFMPKIAAKDKVTYSYALSAKADPDGPDGSQVTLVRGDWNKRFLDRHEEFPDGKFKDDVDASSLGMHTLSTFVGKAPLDEVVLPTAGAIDSGLGMIYG